MLPRRLLVSLLLFVHLVTWSVASSNLKNQETKASLDGDSFFGNIADHEENLRQLAKDFFKEETEEAVPTRATVVEPAAKDTTTPNDSSTRHGGTSPARGGDSPGIASIESGRRFSCTKRALMLYMLTIRTISERLQDLSSGLIPDDDTTGRYLLQLPIEVPEIHQLRQHLETLQVLLDFTPSHGQQSAKSTPRSVDSLSEATERFCRNLDPIERTIRQLSARLALHDPTRSPSGSASQIWSSLSARLPDSLPQLALLFVVTAVLSLILVLFPFRSSRTRMATYTIVVLILGLSLLQFFWKERREWRRAQAKKYNRQLDSALVDECSLMARLATFPRFQCPATASDIRLQSAVVPEPEDDFYEHFNLLGFLNKFTLRMLCLDPLREVALELNDLFETMLDGGKSEDWWSPGAWARSILFSNLFKPIWVMLILWLCFKMFGLFSLLRWMASLLSRVAGDDGDEGGGDQQRPPAMMTSRLQQQQPKPQVVRNLYFINNYAADRLLPIPIQNQNRRILSAKRRQPEPDPEEYVSAEEGDE